ncbi:antiviral reverse transcriptase Drt3a [Idiomarina sp.]|uniref:antiviral reverse transcriptase Drt3a n=1 Tax=Idiomarina sp. TaxID=1874361 RepID=UPI0025BB4AC4|nr:antiviral reverse transcriptase Drt3a [Idiomarina sp.]NQZ05499.1 RNA-directed DNA polymerase [Idiomarina sp.]
MLDQSFSEKAVKLLGINTWRKFQPSTEYTNFVANTYEQVEAKFNADEYQFCQFEKKSFKGKVGWAFASAADEIVAKKLNDNIRRLFKVRPSDRHAIVKQTIALAKDSQPITIARLDIKDFYESLDRESIVKFITEEWLLSHQNRMVLKQWDRQLASQGIRGLPRGMSLSSTLSEIRIRHFDKQMKLDSGVYFYARYVDDIIVFYTGEQSQLKSVMKHRLEASAKELTLNSDKSHYTVLNAPANEVSAEINYLGYKLRIKNNSNRRGVKRKVQVFISNKKVNKVKERVRRAFRAYSKDRRYNLLLARLKFLSANQYIIGDIERTKLKSGIYYNYPLINDHSQLKELDAFYQNFINSGKEPAFSAMQLIKRHGGVINNKRLRQIEAISFQFGFKNRLMNSFTNDLNKKIKRCW